MSDPNWVSGFGVPPVLFVRALCIDSQVALSQSTPPLISRYCHRKGILCCAADVYTFCVRCRLSHLFSTSTHIPAIHLPAAGQELITTRPGKSRLKQKPELAFKSKGNAESARKMVYFDQSVPPSDKRVAEEALRSTGHQACQFLDRHVTLLITCHKVSCIYIYMYVLRFVAAAPFGVLRCRRFSFRFAFVVSILETRLVCVLSSRQLISPRRAAFRFLGPRWKGFG